MFVHANRRTVAFPSVIFTGFLCLTAPITYAADAASVFKVSGFMSVTAGTVLNGDRDEPLEYNPDVNCPCVVTDWGNNGIYEGSAWSFKPDTKAGLQLGYKITDQLSLTGQVVSRASDPMPSITWAYASYAFTDNWQLDVGRKRIPIYFYSDFQDLGVAYPWITPPAELYGWESTNYDGASVAYKTRLAGANVRTSVFAGQTTAKDNPYVETYSQDDTNTQWNKLIGTDMEISKGWWTTRLVYIQTDVQFDNKTAASKDRADMSAYGLAFNGDFDSWFFLTEMGRNVRNDADDPYYGRIAAPSYSVGAGYRFAGRWTVFANTAQYREISNESDYEYFRFRSDTLALRYDLTPKSDIKLQFDKHDDDSFNYTGSADLLRISYDMVF
jgi:hypothetical protein